MLQSTTIKTIKTLTVFLVVSLMPLQSAFAKSSGDDLVQQLKAMDNAQLEKFSQVLGPHWINVHALGQRKDNNDIKQGLESVRALAAYNGVQENIEVLIDLLRSEAKRLESKTQVEDIFTVGLAALGELGTSDPTRYVEELQELRQEVKKRAGASYAHADQIDRAFADAIAAFQGNNTKSVSLTELLVTTDQNENGPLQRLKKFEDYLANRVIGQPEAIELLTYMELRGKFYGQTRTLPEVAYLMGLPGTGKDTIAEAWVDAMFRMKGAHVKHLFRLPTMKTSADLWKVSGSNTGYFGSGQFPPFLRYLVEHSDGKYKLEEVEENREKTYKIVENPEYQGKTLPGYFSPDTAVLFANEFHNWSRDLKDTFLKQALEKGYFSINSPHGGLSEIYVPVRILAASNEGISLLTSREANGQRFGKPLDYDQIMDKWKLVEGDKAKLKNEIQSTNGSPNDPKGRGGEALGTSEELMDRIPERNILLLRPQSPEGLQKIATLSLDSLNEKLGVPSELFASVNLKWSDNVIKFVQGYKYNAEENSRPILGRIMSTVEEPILKAIRDGKIKPTNSKVEFNLDIEQNPDRTQSLIIKGTQDGKPFEIKQLILETKQDIPKAHITDERIDELAQFAEKTSKEVFGVEDVVERLGDRILNIANELSSANTDRPVNAVGLFGLTSTGKTELAKKVAKGILGDEKDLLIFDFSQIQTLADFKKRILGSRDERGNPIKSDFMKAYDRNNGVVVCAFDEISNIKDPDLLKALYDFFREGTVTTFSDGISRKMGGVFAIITGNAGQAVYAAVPSDLPEDVQMAAWKKIAEKLQNDINLQMATLEKYIPWPLLARIGKNNIFFVSPHTFKSLRQLAQLKLMINLKEMAVTDGRRGFNIGFSSTDEYSKFIDTVIDEGFTLRTQGASIDSFIRDDVRTPLQSLLLKNKVPPGSNVVLQFNSKTDNTIMDTAGYVIYDVFVEGKAEPLQLKIRRPYREKALERSEVVDLLTAYHEAGHTIARQGLFPGIFSPVEITIIEGVANIGDEWVYYAGLATNEKVKAANITRDYVIRSVAVNLAGETAERLVSKGEHSSAGKSDDIKRATRMIQDAILRWGLSEKWGADSVPNGMSMENYINGLSDGRRKVLEDEVQTWMKEGRELAQQVLEMNYETALLPLGAKLAEQGKVNAQELNAFYQANPIVDPTKVAEEKRQAARAKSEDRQKYFKNAIGETELLPGVPHPQKMANIKDIAAKEKADLYAQVPLPELVPVLSNATFDAWKAAGHQVAATVLACDGRMTKKK